MAMTMTTPAEVLLEQSRLQLRHQEGKLGQIRTISAVVLIGAGVVEGLVLSGLGPRHRGWAIAATVVFGVSVLICTSVLAPRKDLRFGESLDSYKTWIDLHRDEPGVDRFALGLADNLEASRVANTSTVENMATALQYQVATFGLEVILWAIAALVR